MNDQLISKRFPPASAYNPEWVLAGISGAANPLWMAEWLSESLDLRPGMRVLDLGCGRALSSVFLPCEFSVQVWAADLWFDGTVHPHLHDWWTAESPWRLHSLAWWRHHWRRTGIVDIEVADTLPDGWRFWLDWLRLVGTDNAK